MPPSPPPLLTRSFALLVVGHFLQALGYASMLLLPLYLEHLGASRAEIGTVMAMAAVSGVLARPAIGWALDAIGRRTTIFCGTAFLVVSMVLLAFVVSIGPLVVVARIIYGVGVGAMVTSYFTFAADTVPPDRRAEGLALFGISGLLPMALNPIVHDLGVETADLRWIYPVLAVVVASNALAVAGVPEPARAKSERAPTSWLAGAAQALSRREVWPSLLATLAFGGLFSTFATFSVVAAAARGIESSADIWFAYAATAVGVRLVGARLPDRVGTHNVIAPPLASYGGAMVLLAGAETHGAFMLAGVLAGFGHGYSFPVLSTQMVTRVPDALRGAALATFTGLWEIAALIAPPLLGLLADARGDAAMFAAVAVGTLVILVAWAVAEHRAPTQH